MIASHNTLQNDVTKWNHDSMFFHEESNRLAMNMTSDTPETDVSPTNTKESHGLFNAANRERRISSRTQQIRRSKCGKLGHMLSDCGGRERTNEPAWTRCKSPVDDCWPKAALVTNSETRAQKTHKLNAVCEP